MHLTRIESRDMHSDILFVFTDLLFTMAAHLVNLTTTFTWVCPMDHRYTDVGTTFNSIMHTPCRLHHCM